MQTKDTEDTTTSKKRPNHTKSKQIFASPAEYSGDISYDKTNSSDNQNPKEKPNTSNNKPKRKGGEKMSVIHAAPDKTKSEDKNDTESKDSEPAENENRKRLSVIYASPDKNRPNVEKSVKNQAHSHNEPPENESGSDIKRLSVIYAAPDKTKRDNKEGTMKNVPDGIENGKHTTISGNAYD